ncbi:MULTISPECIES: homoserine O-acetyltransferase [Oleiagrimonas]|jgi:homoserine O-acetyltransferase/O-succinyltransferase|uniref:Serine O-succinyltransferase n=1 Tax=Oleiagrimonas citrea TaxID=1665687 RepID=A0A846ZLI3_9GAMM|nr:MULTISPECIES: homoserine O-acetyltransferase [Oleiagrimonas]NKZ39054.1 homoserine O-acetyltransferase [Oleiagrimonas citrea]RAP57665.1 homoserine O-acetyltransferase [Oleiagrimonas sp. MCCC 1A03011]
MADARRYHDLPSPFAMKRGGELHDAHVAYETWGTLDDDAGNAILILTGLSPSAHAASNEDDPSDGWWEAMIGPGKPIDTNRWFVVCVNSLGSDKGSTGPASINPDNGEPYRLDFPELTLEDVANAAHCVIESLGITRLACLIGCSMGGMAALGYMLQHPGTVSTHISVDTAPQAQPFAIAIRSLQREAIRLDRNWNEGRYSDEDYPERGMSIARKLGVITYRSAMEWNGRFARIRLDPEERPGNPFGFEFQVESYLQAHSRKFVRHFDPNCYLYLSRASDWFDVAEYGDGSVHEGLKRICIERALVIGVTTDILFPLEQQEQIAKGLEDAGADVEFVALDSPQGHDAFLVDIEHYGPAIGGFLDRLPR